MRPPSWHPPVELSPLEQQIVKRIRRAKLFPFLRRVRHELFDDAFQAELSVLYEASPFGQPPVPPAKLALATILQAYFGVSDDEVIEALAMDRRWQLVLDCLDCEEAPFGKATLQRFWQGDRARFLGIRKNLFDLRRNAVVNNLHVLMRTTNVQPQPLAEVS